MADRADWFLSLSWRLPLEGARQLTRLALSPFALMAGDRGAGGSTTDAVEHGIDNLFLAMERAAGQIQERMLDLLYRTVTPGPVVRTLQQDAPPRDPEPRISPDPADRRPDPAPAAGGGTGPAVSVRVENTAQTYLDLLEALGVRYFFGNAGSDFPSLIDAFAKRAQEGKTAPQPILVPHEACAVSMATAITWSPASHFWDPARAGRPEAS